VNTELQHLFQTDQQERAHHPSYDTPAYWALRERDRNRRRRVHELITAGELAAPEDYYYAAMIFQHGETVEEIGQAWRLAQQSAALGYRPARWLTAATYDRWLMYQSRPQKYGTQIVPDGRRHRVWDVEPETTDEERAAWDVPPLAEQHRRAEELTRTEPIPPLAAAPDWLKAALKRWGEEDHEPG
jgi:hypothetical protein